MSSTRGASASLERELRRMEVIARREQVRLLGRTVPRVAERMRPAVPPSGDLHADVRGERATGPR